MTQDTVRVPNSDSEDRGFDPIHRLSSVENMMEEMTRSQTWTTQSGAAKMIPMKKEKREWLTPRRQASELKNFIEFCKAGSLRMNDDILNTFIPESEKEFFTGHTDTNWNELARTAITTKGIRDSPEASRAIEILQPDLESGFEAAKAIALLTVKELEKAHFMEEEKERLR
ncbi:uncharacterized protein MONOS_16467 [Monocercomonoides exilis]|uniref:uncharacterized protein n=1 Tax=Monocercomonoides exilis TaxID=2049356 RepID=UPI003559B29A|nr:hypothetical protein MONOS_16467 [Monocercomonoides exilis]|eukprot:MONOS_16467.1-p1 / transcript=MONOS_16467.1 / gene=MONOS_16467 / organism=Monocercomonoides_exilis_PA203 / gene_product=unspecified product / transcript_product=unspecified product / location=Mono_scaffold01767:2706-3446(-) / protein_length=171 / sequence_SO=supercontig / SO=protein_coding / is_pseudo=false